MTMRTVDFECNDREWVYEIEAGSYKPVAVGYWGWKGFVELPETHPMFDEVFEAACLHAVGGL